VQTQCFQLQKYITVKRKRKNEKKKTNNNISSSEFSRLLPYGAVSQVHISCSYLFLPDLSFYPNSLQLALRRKNPNI